MSQTKNIAILGTGMVGKSLAIGLDKHGYKLVMGTRDPNKQDLVKWRNETLPTLDIQTFKEAVKDVDLILLAVNWNATDNVLEEINDDAVNGVTLIDLTNPLDFSSGAPELALGFNDSAGETVQRKIPQANVVKALNTVTASLMVDPTCEEGIPDMVIAGDDDNAKQQVTELLEEIGWRVIDAGDITKSRLIEPLAMLWINHSIKTGSANHVFSLLRK